MLYFFFFNDPATTEIYTLSLHDALPIYRGRVFGAVSALEGVTVLAGTLGSGYLSRLAGIIPVLAVQGAGYVVAGLAMLVWLKEEPGERAGVGAQRQDGPARSEEHTSELQSQSNLVCRL